MLSLRLRQHCTGLLAGTATVGLLVYCASFSQYFRSTMAWRSSGSSNSNLIDNLHSKFLINHSYFLSIVMAPGKRGYPHHIFPISC